MCGIAGIWQLDGRPVERATIERFVAALAHRGPDGEGILLADDGRLAPTDSDDHRLRADHAAPSGSGASSSASTARRPRTSASANLPVGYGCTST